MNQNKKITEKKYISFLNELKFEITFGDVYVIRPYIDKHKVNSQWETFLKEKQIVYKNKDGKYIWEEMYQPDIKMVREFQNHVSKINKALKINKITKNNVTNTTKKIKIMRSKPSPSKELGLIRRFFKWIY
jgi:hypothetical protein